MIKHAPGVTRASPENPLRSFGVGLLAGKCPHQTYNNSKMMDLVPGVSRESPVNLTRSLAVSSLTGKRHQ